MNNSSQRALLRETYDFDAKKPLSPLAEMCLRGDVTFDRASQMFISMLIEEMVAACGGNKAEAARRLKINRTTLNEAEKRMGVRPHRMARQIVESETQAHQIPIGGILSIGSKGIVLNSQESPNTLPES